MYSSQEEADQAAQAMMDKLGVDVYCDAEAVLFLTSENQTMEPNTLIGMVRYIKTLEARVLYLVGHKEH